MPPFKTAQPIGNDECTLNQFTDQFINAYQPVAHKQNSYFINQVPEGLKLRIDKEGLATLLGSMFYIMASCSRDTCINVSAEFFSDVVLLHIHDTNTFNGYAIRSKRQHLQQLAEKIGGTLTITGELSKETTITFSFTNHATTQPAPIYHMKSHFANGLACA
ncbi:MAG: hypothetical protein JWM28_170 [Chitinophagaceae bacterium]|nr:hypothetical protein [Chitinophagaceae bacterium]